MKRIILILSLLIAASSMAFGQESLHKDKIILDSEVKIGKLDNGLTYYIRHNDYPKNRADFYIANNVGAMQEEDNQNGLAHFLEHLAFNGLKHFPKSKDMLNYLSANGVRFGYNVNAYTSRNRTVYNMSDIPLTRESFIDSVVLILHDWSYYILCKPEEIESERGVIREEWRLGDDSRSRMYTHQDQLLYKGSKYAKRDVIGDFNIINTFERQTLIDFYHKWYRPDLQAVIIVGDFDVNEMEARVKRILSNLPKIENGAQKEVYDIPYLTEPLIGVATDHEIKYYTVKYILKQRYPTTEELQYFSSYKNSYARGIFTDILGKRLAKRAKDEDCNYKSAVAVNGQLAMLRHTTMFTISPKDETKMLSSFEDVLTEVKRVEKYGFSKDEFDLAKSTMRKKLQFHIEKKPEDVTNDKLVSSYIDHFTNNIPFQYPVDFYKKLAEVFDSITLDDVNNLTGEMITEAEEVVMYSMNEKKREIAPSEEATLAMMAKVKEADIEKPQNMAKSNVSLEVEGLEGSPVIKEKALKNFGAEEWTLANGIKVVWTPTPESEGKVDMMFTAKNNIGFAQYEDIEMVKIANRVIGRMGVRGIENEDLQDMLREYDMRNVSLKIGKKAGEIESYSSGTDFEKMLSMIYLYINEPNFDPVHFKKHKQNFFDNLKEKGTTDKGIVEFKDTANMALYNYHPWTLIPDSAAYARTELEDVKNIFDKQFSDMKDYTFFITGTLPKETVKPLVEKYIGSLKTSDVKVKVPKDTYKYVTGDVRFERTMRERDIPKANVDYIYHGKLKYNSHNNMVLKYVRQIMWLRYVSSIREDKGGTYHVGVTADLNSSFSGWYDFTVSFETDPKLVDMLVEEVNKGILDLAENGPSEKEMEETLKYLLKTNSERKEKRMKSVMYWAEKSILAYEKGVVINDDDDTEISSVKAKEVQDLAKKLIKGNHFISVYKEKYPNK